MPDAASKVAVAPRKPDPPLIVSAAGAEDASEQGQKTLDDGLPAAKSPTTDLGRQLWRTVISAYKEPVDSHSKSRLQHVIGQIRAVKLKKQEKTPGTIMVESVLKTEPNGPSQGAPAPERIQSDSGPISEETLEILQARLQNPEQLANPLQLAEILFRTGYRQQAAICYREALERIDPNEPGSADDIAWILFQLGDCLTEQDPTKAIDTYTRLVEEYPESIWTGPAKARSSLVAWYQQAQPRALIDPNDDPVARPVNQIPTTRQ
ncbi:MAG: tetratricopeptide repeat protein [Phycisphaerales bacterium]|nr:MAG: tetratricopeptide repeat protein [Phycisphaerales bacterium]